MTHNTTTEIFALVLNIINRETGAVEAQRRLFPSEVALPGYVELIERGYDESPWRTERVWLDRPESPGLSCSAVWSRNQGVSCCVDTPHAVHRGSSEPDAPSWGDGECVPGTLTAGRGGR